MDRENPEKTEISRISTDSLDPLSTGAPNGGALRPRLNRAPWMVLFLALSLSGLSCTGLFGPEDAPIRVENETDLGDYSADAEIVITLKNIGKKRIGVDYARFVQQWNGQEWVDGLLIHAPNQGVILEPTYRYLRPGESLRDTVPVNHMGVGLVGEYRIIRVIISKQNRNGILSATNSFTIQE